ncbi:hypothetical protein GF327_03610 [Candidatus Woesearchaeota archaeon]|nr:hypothetical protein [Candidatus Woesearchaeota archaeon]
MEQEIFTLFTKDITLQLSINQISKKLDKSYPYINKKVNELIEQEIFNKTKIGRSHLCSVNLRNDKARVLLMLNEIEKKERYLKKTNLLDKEKIFEITGAFNIFTILQSGQRLIFVLNYLNDKEAIKNKFPYIKKLDPEFFEMPDFKQEILSDKSIIKDHVILYSFEKYFEILQEIQKELLVNFSPIYAVQK